MTDKSAPASIVIERRYAARAADLWALWTTPEGLESWWGPPGFAVTVEQMDLRAGGTLRYTMRAIAPKMVAFMQKNGMPTATLAEVVYDQVTPQTRLTYRHLVDFVPGHAPYHTSMAVDLLPDGDAILMRLTFDRMHNSEWTERQRMGWELELGKLKAVLQHNRP